MAHRLRSILLLTIAGISLHACATSTAVDSSLFLPDNARNVRTDETRSGKQLTFTVTRKYPDLGWNATALEKAQSAGWRKCTGPNLWRWTVYGDRTGAQPQMVHRYVLMLTKSDRAMMVIGQYYSPISGDRGISSSTPPENDEQHVTVLEVVGDVERTKAMFTASCA